MQKARFYFLEPSKVGNQHITLIEGYLNALVGSPRITSAFDIVLCASKRTLTCLPASLLGRLKAIAVPVMDPESRRLVRKSLLELFVVVRQMLKLGRDDLMFVSCLLPTTLLMLEVVNIVLRRHGVHVVLHGEIEGIFDDSHRSMRRIAFWSMLWLRLRPFRSRIRLVAIDDFIKEKLLGEFPGKLNSSSLSVVHFPITPFAGGATSQGEFRACFIGYRTRLKDFESFRRMSDSHPQARFVAVGGGVVEWVPAGTKEALHDKDAYMSAISACSVALFPYASGYTSSLSAALVDALSTGVRVLALDRPCFQSMSTYFGSDMVGVHSSVEELNHALREIGASVADLRSRALRIKRLEQSKYSIESVQADFCKLALGGSK